MSAVMYALLDKENVVRRLVNWDGVGHPDEFGTLTPVLVSEDAQQSIDTGDTLADGVLTKGIPLDVQMQVALRAKARSALGRLREIKKLSTDPVIGDLAEVMIVICRLLSNQLDGMD